MTQDSGEEHFWVRAKGDNSMAKSKGTLPMGLMIRARARARPRANRPEQLLYLLREPPDDLELGIRAGVIDPGSALTAQDLIEGRRREQRIGVLL